MTGAFSGACVRLWLASLPGIIATAWVVGAPLVPPNGAEDLLATLGLLAGGLAAVMLLGLPLVAVRRWIVSERFPYLDWGYGLVALYGPVLLIWTLEPGLWPSTKSRPGIYRRQFHWRGRPAGALLKAGSDRGRGRWPHRRRRGYPGRWNLRYRRSDLGVHGAEAEAGTLVTAAARLGRISINWTAW